MQTNHVGLKNTFSAGPEERCDSPTLGTWFTKNTEAGVSDDDLAYFRAYPAAAPPPSPLSPSRSNMPNRPRAPTPSNLQTAGDWNSDYDQQYEAVSPSSAYIVDSPASGQPSPSFVAPYARHPPGRSVAEDEPYVTDSGFSQSPARSPKLAGLPDPSQYPDPYPFRPPHWLHGTSTPALSSGDSSSASTRSSAYTNSARSGDYGHVHVVTGSDEPEVGVGITTDNVVQLLDQDPSNSSSQASRAPVDQARWSDLYAHGARSRSSSTSGGNLKTDNTHDADGPKLHGKASFDMHWQPVDEREEIGLTSEDETDDDGLIDEDENRDDDQGDDEVPTSAMIIAEEGLGVIVGGNDVPISHLQVNPGTTHLLIGSSNTPNAVPAFLTNTIPHITTTLLALDISANFLVALPPALASCICLEELNIASNPLRALPVFLSSLASLKVLIADSCGLSTLPPALDSLDKLHSLSIRRNKMHSLPGWLCLLPALETLLVDGNPFLGPWTALVEPLLAKTPMSPLYPPSTPMFPPPSASLRSSETDIEDEDPSEPRSPPTAEDEDTITPARAPILARSVTAPVPVQALPSPSPTSLTRTRTTPNKAYYDKSRAASKSVIDNVGNSSLLGGQISPRSDEYRNAEREIRKMKSAGELRRNHANLPPTAPPSHSATSSPQRPALSTYASASSSNLLQINASSSDEMPKRFASLGVTSGALLPAQRHRPQLDHGMWQNPPSGGVPPAPPEKPAYPRPMGASPPSKLSRDSRYKEPEIRPVKEEKDKSNRWGFLKKMSMGKMRVESPGSSRPSTAQGRPSVPAHIRPTITTSVVGGPGPEGPRVSVTPHIDVRISTTGSLLNSPNSQALLPPNLSKKPSSDMLKLNIPPSIAEVDRKPSPDSLTVPSSNNLLAPPPSPTPRATKRRSFLPFDHPLPIPPSASFNPGVTATNGLDDDVSGRTPSPQMPQESMEQIQRREAEKAREARTRALRSVMAYLRDMYDLGLSQTNTLSMYGGDAPGGVRSRRPTMVENGRLTSDMSITSGSSISSRPDSSVHLRSSEVRVGIRNGSTTQTNSVATTDSTGSSEERKYKDDKAKRARVVREIVETERTYVKGLQELVDIYIKPAGAPVTGISSGKDSIVPAAERKIVFNGLESLFGFHKESFLPMLEKAAAPVMRPSAEVAEHDTDGSMSLAAARAVAQIFVSHAAFMKMYSTYINNFDNSVQRIKAWLSDKASTTPAQTLSPQSSTAQLVGLGLTMGAVTAPLGTLPDGQANLAPLSSSQRKRIKGYLKRCRMNPRHSQLNLEGYLLLPVQRIPRYKLLLEELIRSCPPMYEYMEDPLDRALAEISGLATNMNEGKREAETRRKLVLWQSRIRGKFPSPLVQPHRRLIMDGPLHLTRVVRKATVSFEVIDSKGDASTVQVECLSPELTERSLVGVLCNDLLVLCRDPSDGQDPNSQVDLWAVLRMQTLPQPASIVRGNALRLVDNKAILYFDTPSTSDAMDWFRAINLNMASKA